MFFNEEIRERETSVVAEILTKLSLTVGMQTWGDTAKNAVHTEMKQLHYKLLFRKLHVHLQKALNVFPSTLCLVGELRIPQCRITENHLKKRGKIVSKHPIQSKTRQRQSQKILRTWEDSHLLACHDKSDNLEFSLESLYRHEMTISSAAEYQVFVPENHLDLPVGPHVPWIAE
mgnify:CR=1 FL=1